MDARSAYRETAVQGASPSRLVVLLYEQAIQDLQRALAAIEAEDIEKRTDEINHALSVVSQLQATLNMSKGGEIASNLERFYNLLRGSLLTAQVHASPEIIQRLVNNLLVLREAWLEVERAVAPKQQKGVPAAGSLRDGNPLERLMEVLPETIRSLNCLLRHLATGLKEKEAASKTGPELAALLPELLRVGEWVQSSVNARPDREMAGELLEYRTRLEELYGALPELHAQLLVERVRLQNENDHLKNASQWACGNQDALFGSLPPQRK